MPLKFKFLDRIQHRSPRIPKADWEKHKEDIVREYMSNDLSHTIEWMARNRKFHASAKQFGHQLKRWGVKKYRKSDQATSDSGNPSPFNVLERKEREENQQIDDSAPASVKQVEAAYGPSNGTPCTDKATESVNGNERESQSGHMSASPSANCVSPEKSIDKGSPANGGELPTDSVGLHERKTTEPYPPMGVGPWDPTLGSGPLSPGTRSFLEYAKSISRLKRDKPSAQPLSIQAMKPQKASRSRQRPDEVGSVDSLSDAISSLYMGSGGSSRRASVDMTSPIRMEWSGMAASTSSSGLGRRYEHLQSIPELPASTSRRRVIALDIDEG